MIDRPAEISPQVYARVGGVLYLYIIVAGIFGETSRGNLIVSGDPTATARNIMASELLWRVSIAGEFVHLACAVTIALILYVLLAPVSKNLALLAAFFNLVSIAIESVSRGSLFAVLLLLGRADYLKAFDPHQLYALAYLCLRLYDYGFGVSLVFFACNLLIWGYLLFRSGYFPKFLGVLLTIAALCYLINSFADFVAPAFAKMIYPAILVPAGLSELILCLWLIVMGVNVPKWREKTSRLAS